MRPTSTFHIARRAVAALVAAAALLGVAGTATASAAEVNVWGDYNERLIYSADLGEKNRVKITYPGFATVRVDDIQPIDVNQNASNHCSHPFLLDGTVVDCILSTELFVHLEDGQNELESSAPLPLFATGAGAESNDFRGGPSADTLIGGNGKDRLAGGEGDDELSGLGSNDTLIPGTGADVVKGGDGGDRVEYTERTQPVSVTIDGVDNDGVAGEHDNVKTDVESVTGGTGNDTIVDLAGAANAFDGGPGSDTIKGGEGWDATLVGGEGADTIDGGNGHDMLFAGPGEDSLKGGADNDQLWGEDGQDTLVGGLGSDIMGGGADFDIVSYAAYSGGVTVDLDGEADDGGRREHDNVGVSVEQVTGGSGPDTLIGNAATQLLVGGLGADTIDGGGGADVLYGNEHGDKLLSDDGVKDSVFCGTGIDGLDADDLDSALDCETRG